MSTRKSKTEGIKIYGKSISVGAQPIAASFGSDAEADLTNMLSDELARNIDQEIINDLMKHMIPKGLREKLDTMLKEHVRNRNIDTII